MRQDSVLSSVFKLISNLLQRKRETRQRHLLIRTYNIVPVAAQAGVVEWVDGTAPLGDILVEGYAAAQSRNKSQWSLNQCRQKMKLEHEKQGSDLDSKLKLFKTIQSKLPPVFGSLFFSMFRDPQTWYKTRSQYVRSISTTSMAGYIVGIGDRHAQNILFDKNTGELIHIDLGIAFDQGRLLSTPEIVPFRLTQNMGTYTEFM